MKVYLFNHSNCNHPSLEVVLYLFLSLKGWQSSILWSVLCCFYSLYRCYHSLSLIAIYRHLLSLVVTHCITFCSTYCHSLSLVVTCCTTRCRSLYHSLSLVAIHCDSLSLIAPLPVTRCTIRLSFYKLSFYLEEIPIILIDNNIIW